MDLQCEAAKERNVQCIELEKVVQISKRDDKDVISLQKVALFVLDYYSVERLVIIDVVVMQVYTILSCCTKLAGS